jgi:hypothetical protein
LAITRISTAKSGKGLALAMDEDGETIVSLRHDELTTYDTIAKIKLEVNRQAARILQNVYFHINRDGSLAVATGFEPSIWPENEPEDKEP